MDDQKERAVFFIDGSNWYHAAKKSEINTSAIDYRKFARKLSQQHREVVQIRYYIGRVSGDLSRSRSQASFLSLIKKQGVKVISGRVEKKRIRPENNKIQKDLRELLSAYGNLIKHPVILNKLKKLAHQDTYSYTEKRVDVNIAVDMVAAAMKDEFDVAYLISADGDFIPAVETVRETGKKVFAATPASGYELKKAVNKFIYLKPEWFSDDIFLESLEN